MNRISDIISTNIAREQWKEAINHVDSLLQRWQVKTDLESTNMEDYVTKEVMETDECKPSSPSFVHHTYQTYQENLEAERWGGQYNDQSEDETDEKWK